MRRTLSWIGIAVLMFLVYAQSLGNDFVTWDDRLLITENPIAHGLTWGNIIAAFTSYDPELYIPLTFFSYQINYAIHGLQPMGYHLVNLILHILNALLVGAIIAKLRIGEWRIENSSLQDKRTKFSILHSPFSIVAALLFALHSLHTEAVVWAAARKDVLSTFFLLISVFLYLQHERRKYWLSVAVFALALLSKVSVITWPLLIPMLDWYFGAFDSEPQACRPAARFWNSCKRAAPYFALSIIFGIVALGGKIANTGFLYEKILIGCRAVTLLLQKFFWPTSLSALYPFTKPISITTPELGFSVLFILFVFFVLLWLAWKKDIRLPLFAGAWFFLFLAPSMSNILKGHNELLDIYVTSDRYAYLPSVGLLLVAGILIGGLCERFPKVTHCFIALIVIALGVLSYRQSLVWKNTMTLFTHVSEVQPNSYVAWNNIGTEYVHQGRLNEGLHAYGKALAIRNDATTWYNVGQILRAQGKIDLAMQAYERAIKSSPLEVDAKRALDELRMEN